jgi:hypothetical protein
VRGIFSRRILLYVTAPLALLSVVAIWYATHSSPSLPKDNEYTGHEFAVEGQVVDAVLDDFPRSIRSSDSLTITLRLKAAPSVKSLAGLANEAHGALTPSLTAADCTVTPQGATSMTIPTKQYSLDEFVWTWSIDGCKTAGVKALQLLLVYAGDSATGDPHAYKREAFVRVTEPFSLTNTLAALGAISSFLTAASLIVNPLLKKRSDSPT